jgi:large subunit ribosomal protein L3
VAIEMMCRKIGMTQLFNETGVCETVTVLEAGPNVVVQKKSTGKDGYSAAQLGFGQRRASLFSKAEIGHFEKGGVGPKRYLHESRLSAEEVDALELGQELRCDMFEAGQDVDVTGTSKGRGTAGVVKRHGMAIKKRTHGTHEAFRHAGSIGAGTYPGRVIKGKKMPGRMGNERVTVRNLKVVRVDADQNLLFVRGSVPGHANGIVRVRHAVASHR